VFRPFLSPARAGERGRIAIRVETRKPRKIQIETRLLESPTYPQIPSRPMGVRAGRAPCGRSHRGARVLLVLGCAILGNFCAWRTTVLRCMGKRLMLALSGIALATAACDTARLRWMPTETHVPWCKVLKKCEDVGVALYSPRTEPVDDAIQVRPPTRACP
jgi:hypothetical protein